MSVLNPLTGRYIQEGGATHRRILKQIGVSQKGGGLFSTKIKEDSVLTATDLENMDKYNIELPKNTYAFARMTEENLLVVMVADEGAATFYVDNGKYIHDNPMNEAKWAEKILGNDGTSYKNLDAISDKIKKYFPDIIQYLPRDLKKKIDNIQKAIADYEKSLK